MLRRPLVPLEFLLELPGSSAFMLGLSVLSVCFMTATLFEEFSGNALSPSIQNATRYLG